ncbi:hypothetical protein EK21DRAFT_83781 [Setomelanomma holmii]|uniref:Uncharacterized protein n=1 Tax=Setomelanomma holmii TaxID=210430 RepID=A0A9P4LQD5_9PLEO|nr:hypothetical protein EK21DRAFT_83781 [Setomelanomma holmii]
MCNSHSCSYWASVRPSTSAPLSATPRLRSEKYTAAALVADAQCRDGCHSSCTLFLARSLTLRSTGAVLQRDDHGASARVLPTALQNNVVSITAISAASNGDWLLVNGELAQTRTSCLSGLVFVSATALFGSLGQTTSVMHALQACRRQSRRTLD